ncbi:ABC transporter substrate-binding protein [Microvirga mediterraneensis]|uniref:Peptide ABC transporter substrate-binding protein n=1 Tax=Microvirga mediterraneensis TaxID=2754695 RepID=A0A838BMG8_9HYPH|nr:ABC transporter substrate-binding protein [Microvirga mediterraneensis]MBA1156864.1 peptide ABC transporter substrate-binding protein [Microvirga mediterraneensis]
MNSAVTIVQPRLRLEDPHDCTDANDILAVFDAIYDGLVRYGRDGGFVPGLAAEWRADPEARHWTFTLREGLTFHDGSPCDAEAVCLSLRRMARPDKGYTLGAPGVWHQYLGDAVIEPADRLTVDIRLSRPIADLLDILVYGYVVAPSALARYESGDTKMPVGTGPYRLTEVIDGQEVRLERFENWHGERPANAVIRFKLEPDAQKRLAMLQSGEAQVANSLDFRASMELEARGDRTRVVFLAPVSIIYLFNAARGPLSDPRIRRALNLAVDRKALIEQIVHGAAQPLTGFVGPAHFGSDPTMDEGPDLEEARRLLAEAGYANGLVLEVDCPTRLPDEAQALTKAVSDQVSAIGVSLNVHLHEDREAYAHGVRLKKVRDMCVFDSSPLSTFRVLAEKIDARVAGSWWLGYHNEAVERLLDTARQTSDDAAREALYRQAYRHLQDDPAWFYLYNPLRVTGLAGSHPDWRMRRDGVLDVAALPALAHAERSA